MAAAGGVALKRAQSLGCAGAQPLRVWTQQPMYLEVWMPRVCDCLWSQQLMVRGGGAHGAGQRSASGRLILSGFTSVFQSAQLTPQSSHLTAGPGTGGERSLVCVGVVLTSLPGEHASQNKTKSIRHEGGCHAHLKPVPEGVECKPIEGSLDFPVNDRDGVADT